MKTDPLSQNFPAPIETELKEAIAIGAQFFLQPHGLESTTGAYTGQSQEERLTDSQLNSLIDLLYSQWYLRPPKSRSVMNSNFKQNFCELLRSAHQGSYRWETGWQAVKVSNAGRVVARRGEEERILTTTDYISLKRPGLPPPPGSSIDVVARRDSQSLSPGFWVTQTAKWANGHENIIRLYWNIPPEGAPLLVRELTTRMDDDLPYCLKMPAKISAFDRVDTAVLYLPAGYFGELIQRLKEIHSAVARHLEPEIPKLTRKLADGLGIAEDPPNEDESFGMHRCRLVAQGIANAFRTEAPDPDRVLEAIHYQFSAAGIPPQRPHLNSVDNRDYHFG